MGPARPSVLIVDDELPLRRAVRHAMEAEGFRVLEAGTARDAVDQAAAARPDAIVLDLGLPDADGGDVCRDVRAFSAAPILVLSARHSDAEKVALLDAGADDYVTKPFSTDELRARVRALIRRAARAEAPVGAVIARGDLEIDFVKRFVKRRGELVHLTPIEWELLRALAAHPGRTLTHQQIFHAAWKGREHGDAQQYLRVHVAHLRRKLEDDPVRPRHIFTVPGVGYRFGE
jgi:two-component system KDP operon response regulator KdpE